MVRIRLEAGTRFGKLNQLPAKTQTFMLMQITWILAQFTIPTQLGPVSKSINQTLQPVRANMSFRIYASTLTMFARKPLTHNLPHNTTQKHILHIRSSQTTATPQTPAIFANTTSNKQIQSTPSHIYLVYTLLHKSPIQQLCRTLPPPPTTRWPGSIALHLHPHNRAPQPQKARRLRNSL